MCSKSLKLIDKKKKKSMQYSSSQYIYTNNKSLYDEGRKYGEGETSTGFSSDEEKQADMSKKLAPTVDLSEINTKTIDFSKSIISVPSADTAFLKTDLNTGALLTNARTGDSADASLAGTERGPISFDPRIYRWDAFKTTDALIPFSQESASSVFYDMVYTVESGVAQEAGWPNSAAKRAADRVAANSDEARQHK